MQSNEYDRTLIVHRKGGKQKPGGENQNDAQQRFIRTRTDRKNDGIVQHLSDCLSLHSKRKRSSNQGTLDRRFRNRNKGRGIETDEREQTQHNC